MRPGPRLFHRETAIRAKRAPNKAAQAGLGIEVFLARGFSLEGDLAYNYAKISNATFAGSAADPGSSNGNGTVDYSGVVAKLAFNIYQKNRRIEISLIDRSLVDGACAKP